MAGLTTRSYIVTLNGDNVCIVHSSGAYALLIQTDMRETHFESIYGIDLSEKTTALEEAYEEEYVWDCIEIETLMPNDAELRVNKIMKNKGITE